MEVNFQFVHPGDNYVFSSMSKGAAVVYFWVLCFQRFLNDLFFSKCMSGMIRVKDLIVQTFTTLNFENTSTAGAFNTVTIGAPFHEKNTC